MAYTFMGHANIKTTKIYAYLVPEKFHGVVGVLELGGKKSQNKEEFVEAIQTST
jgi:hypothetical protein